MGEVGLLLGAAEALALLGLGLLLAGVVVLFGAAAGALLDVFLAALGLGLFGCGGLGISLCLCFGGLLGLLALDFRVLCGVP